MPRKKKTLNARETADVIARLFDRYGIDRSPRRDRALDGMRYELALYYAAHDGLLRVPAKRGAPAKWKGPLGLDLITKVEALVAYLQITGQKSSAARAIELLQKAHPNTWGRYDDLEKRLTDARKTWTFSARLLKASE
jgi:hypothetical protein